MTTHTFLVIAFFTVVLPLTGQWLGWVASDSIRKK